MGGCPPPLPKAPGATGLKYPQARIFETSEVLNPATKAGKREIKREIKRENKNKNRGRVPIRRSGRTAIDSGDTLPRFLTRGVFAATPALYTVITADSMRNRNQGRRCKHVRAYRVVCPTFERLRL